MKTDLAERGLGYPRKSEGPLQNSKKLSREERKVSGGGFRGQVIKGLGGQERELQLDPSNTGKLLKNLREGGGLMS